MECRKSKGTVNEKPSGVRRNLGSKALWLIMCVVRPRIKPDAPDVINVVSWPPHCVAADVKIEAGLPCSAPACHNAPVASKKFFI
mgnify:CR=1 FL=1